MTVTVSTVLILAAAGAVALKTRSVSFGMFILAALFGFTLASTDAAPSITQFMTACGDALEGIGN